MKLALIVNYYTTPHEERQREINKCLLNNLSFKWLDVHVLCDCPPFEGCTYTCHQRPTYQDFFTYIRRLEHGHPKGYTHYAIANSDIYFDETLLLAYKMEPLECYALSRWDVKSDGSVKHHAVHDSQDVWIFESQPTVKGADYYLGLPGCDNRLAHDLTVSGFDVKNPSMSIKPYHVHASSHRTYTVEHIIPPPYRMIRVCEL